jgi:phosphoglycolate phosphatase
MSLGIDVGPGQPPWPDRVEAVLFDLDGTLIDSAPDLAGAVNDLRAELGLPPRPYASLRPMVGSGARGMLGAGLDIRPGDARFEPMRDRFLAIYERRMTRETAPFDSIVEVLEGLARSGLRWGIVTNKAERFALPLVAALGLDLGAAAVVAGDTTPHAKPHPAPLLEAARRAGCPADRCIYVGDDRRDIVAGLAAGMGTVAVSWGYLGDGEPIGAWGAHHVIDAPESLLKLAAVA